MNTPRMLRTVSIVGALGALLLWARPLLAQQSAEELYQAALYQEEVQGNLQRAIDQFGRILVQFSDNRAVGAKAQLHIGLCYEKLGQQEAQQAYRRVIADFPEHVTEVAVAKERLAGIERSEAERHPQPTFEEIRIPTMPRAGGVLSPDGTRLAFVSDGAVWTVPLRGGAVEGLAGEPTQVGNLDDAGSYFGGLSWSADGRWIAVNGEGKVYVLPVDGGETRVVPMPERGSHAYSYRLSLSPDGGTLAFTALRKGQVEGLNETEKRIVYTVPTTRGEPRPVTDMWGRMPAFSPDGRSIAYVSARQPAEGEWGSDLWVVPAEGGIPVEIATSDPGRFRGPIWSPNGNYLAVNYEPGKNNFSQELWIISAEPKGSKSPIVKLTLPSTAWDMPAGWTSDGRLGVFTSTPSDYGAAYIVSAGGGKAGRVSPEGGWPEYLRWSPDGNRLLANWMPNEGDSVPSAPMSAIVSIPAGGGQVSKTPLAWGRDISMGVGFDISPDGKRLVFMGGPPPTARPGPEDANIWTSSVEGRGLTQLTAAPRYDAYPCWSPDGRWIAFIRLLAEDVDHANIYLMPSTGGEARQLTADGDSVAVAAIAFSPDGKTVAFFSEDAIKAVPVEGGRPRVLQRIGGPSTFRELSWSPDGSRLAYTENPRVGKIRVASLSTGRNEELSTGLPPDMRYSHVAWSPDGKKIAFVASQPERNQFWLISDFLPKEGAR